MRNLVLPVVATLVPVLLSAQTLEPRRAAAGTEVTVTADCAATPVILLDTTSITSVGKDATNRWRFALPALSATFTAKPYSVKWKCGTDADKDLGQFEVTRAGGAGG